MRKLPILLGMVALGWSTQVALSATTAPATSPSTQPADIDTNKVLADRLRWIGTHMVLYLNGHNGNLPQDMGALCVIELCSPNLYILPGAENTVPTNWQTMSVSDQCDWINSKGAYEFLGKGLVFGTDYAAQTPLHMSQIVIAYQRGGDVSKGATVLYFDFHVEFDSRSVADERIRDTKAFLEKIESK